MTVLPTASLLVAVVSLEIISTTLLDTTVVLIVYSFLGTLGTRAAGARVMLITCGCSDSGVLMVLIKILLPALVSTSSTVSV